MATHNKPEIFGIPLDGPISCIKLYTTRRLHGNPQNIYSWRQRKPLKIRKNQKTEEARRKSLSEGDFSQFLGDSNNEAKFGQDDSNSEEETSDISEIDGVTESQTEEVQLNLVVAVTIGYSIVFR